MTTYTPPPCSLRLSLRRRPRTRHSKSSLSRFNPRAKKTTKVVRRFKENNSCVVKKMSRVCTRCYIMEHLQNSSIASDSSGPNEEYINTLMARIRTNSKNTIKTRRPTGRGISRCFTCSGRPTLFLQVPRFNVNSDGRCWTLTVKVRQEALSPYFPRCPN